MIKQGANVRAVPDGPGEDPGVLLQAAVARFQDRAGDMLALLGILPRLPSPPQVR